MTKLAIDKRAIAYSFGVAAPKYDSVAHFQRWVGGKLLASIPSYSYSRILDLGTGTGHFIEPLRTAYDPELVCATDLSEGMVRYVADSKHKDTSLVVGDADRLPFKAGSFDLVYSSLAIQWCYDLPHLLNEVSRILAPGGVFAFSTLLDGSLAELKEAWTQVDQSQHVNDFFVLRDYQDAIEMSGLQIIELSSRPKVLEYSRALDLSRELKTLGAHNMTQNRNRGLTGKARMKAFVEHYEGNRMDNGYLPATYQVGFGVLKKRLDDD
jgi:malonyl-CoA O-methyltransferase